MRFLKVTVKDHQIMHGFDKNNKEIIENVKVEKASTKLIAINRILSISETYILTSYADRLIYWEYEENFSDLIVSMEKDDLLVKVA